MGFNGVAKGGSSSHGSVIFFLFIEKKYYIASYIAFINLGYSAHLLLRNSSASTAC